MVLRDGLSSHSIDFDNRTILTITYFACLSAPGLDERCSFHIAGLQKLKLANSMPEVMLKASAKTSNVCFFSLKACCAIPEAENSFNYFRP